MGNVSQTTPLGLQGPSGFAANIVTTPQMRTGWDATARTGWIEVGPSNSLSQTARIIVAAHPSEDRWETLQASVAGAIAQATCERLNRLLQGFDPISGDALVKVYWRNKSNRHSGISVKVPGTRGWTKVPAFVSAIRITPQGTAFRWAVGSKPAAAPAPAPVSASTGTPNTVPMPPASVIVNPPTPVASQPLVAPAPEPEPWVEPVSAPAEPVVPEVVRAQPKRSAPALPYGAGSLFRDPTTLNPGIKVHADPANEARLERAVRRHAAGERTVVTITGPTGTGKTLTATEVAKRNGLPFMKVDAAGMGTFADWAGAVSLKDGAQGVTTAYAPSQLIEAVRADGPYAGVRRMVLLDECNRVVSPSALSALLPLTDGSGTLYVPDAHLSIPIDPAVLWVLTANIGSAYSGTVTLDAALVSRGTSNLVVNYPDAGREATILMEQGKCSRQVAEALVRVAIQTRALSANATITAPGVSTRQLVSAATEVAFGASPLEAAQTAFVNAYDGEGNESSDRAKVLLAAESVLRNL